VRTHPTAPGLLAEPEPDDRPNRGRLRVGGVVVAAAGVAILAGWLLAQPDPASVPAAAQPAPAVASPAAGNGEPAPAATVAVAVPDAAVPDAAVPTTAPADVTWELFRGVALPTSPTHGPTRIDGPVHSGYARTPTGALLADAQITMRRVISEGDSWRQVTESQVVPGPGRDAYVNLRSRVSDEIPTEGLTQFVGFRFVTYTPDLAVVSLATRGSSGAIQVATDTLRWVDGDWRLEVPASGLQQPQVVQSLAGYVPWSGVS
jgi:hypothetical protein